VSFTGACLVHRAEILQLNGAWHDAIEEARYACERLFHANNRKDAAAAFYRQGELHRLRGEFAEAEQAYGRSSEWGWEPQPGLAWLRLFQGRADAAAAGIRRAVSTTTDRLERTRLLPAHVEIMLAVDDIDEARSACDELEQIAESFGTEALRAMANHARGAVELAKGDARAALSSLRRALHGWNDVGAPYEVARVRALAGLACRALADEDGATLELAAARRLFEQLGASPDLARVETLALSSPPVRSYGLTPRELQVLRLVAAGKPNKAIGAELCLSEKTIDRHLSNIFNKLDVSSRTAAAAWAYEHKIF
jgi:DNA-binding NarL/FixJ family response regulator